MKGFIYLIEIAVAAILMTVVLSVFFSIKVKQDWKQSDLIDTGNDILNSIKNKNNFFFNILNGNLTDIESNKPPNVGYGLNISGSPKSQIYVGCTINCDYLQNELLYTLSNYGNVFVNGRWINFTIKNFDINTEIPSYFDVIVLINYTNYSDSTINSRLNNYLNSGGVVIGINATASNSDTWFNNFYNLTAGSGSSSTVNFTFYDPTKDDIAKYFLGIGMDAYTQWYIWGDQWRIDYWNGNMINITNVSNSAINRTSLIEGSNFSLTGPDSKLYFFKVKKMWYNNRVDFQSLNKSFIFKDFSEANVVGNNIVSNSSHAALTTNNSAVWISDFPKGDEYRALLKAAIFSRLDIWNAKGVYTTKERTTISSFTTLCCDMPETAELYLTLWYEI
jgi:hypothetical protein